MGDQVGNSVAGTLYYVPFNEFERIRNLDISAIEKTSLFASFCRINALYMISMAGSGHIGSSFSSLDIMSWIELNEVADSEKNNQAIETIFYSSNSQKSFY